MAPTYLVSEACLDGRHDDCAGDCGCLCHPEPKKRLRRTERATADPAEGRTARRPGRAA